MGDEMSNLNNKNNYFLITILLTLFFSVGVSAEAEIDFNILSGEYYNNTELSLWIDANSDAAQYRACLNDGPCLSEDWQGVDGWPVTFSQEFAFDDNAEFTITAEVADAERTIDSTTDTITFDNAAPTTSFDENAVWHNGSFTITLTCADNTNGVGCGELKYSRNGEANVTKEEAPFELSIEINTQGSHTIDFYSEDVLGNTESTRRILGNLDVTPPNALITTVTNQTVSFDVNKNDSYSDLSLNLFRVDVNGTTSTDFNGDLNCVDPLSNGEYTCSYTESLINATADFNVAVIAFDEAGNIGQAETVYSYVDENAPAKPAQPQVSATSGALKVRWQANSESDMDYYKIYRYESTSDTCDDNTVTDANIFGTLSHSDSSCQGGTCDHYDTNAVIEGNYYCYKVSAVDNSDNTSEISERTLLTEAAPESTPPSSAPSISSFAHSDDSWSTDANVALTWDNITNASGYNCLWTVDNDNALSTTAGDGNSQCSGRYWDENAVANGTYYFKVNACNGAGCSATTTFTVKIDNETPGVPSGLSASVESSSQINLSWDSVSDSPSGTTVSYELYRGTSEGSVDSEVYDGTSTSYNNTGLSAGTTYYYKVRAKDDVGNTSGYSSVVSATTSSSGNAGNNDGGNNDGGSGGDTTDPSVSWSNPIGGTELAPGTIELQATASDNDEIRDVKFYVDNELVGEGDLSDGKYVFSWDASSEELGEHTLKAVVRDDSFNSTDAQIKVTFVEAVQLDAGDAVAEAEAKPANFDERNALLEAYGLELPTSLQELFDSANEKLNEAKSSNEAEEFATAKEKADEAIALFDDLDSKFVVEETSTEISLEEGLSELIEFSGLQETVLEDANTTMQTVSFSKTLKVLKVSDGTETNYYGRIVLTVSNNAEANEESTTQTIQVVEFVPKDFAETASLISSELEFEVLKEDPVLAFTVELNAGESKEISYSSNAVGTEFAENENKAEYFMPCMALGGTEELIVTSDTPTGLFGLGNTLVFLLGGVLLIVIVLVVVLTLHGRRGDSEGLSYSDGDSSSGGFFSGVFSGKEEDKGSKWAYKGD